MDPSKTTEYEICIRGTAGTLIADAFDELTVNSEGDRTFMYGELPDQAALLSVLARIRELGLELLWTRKLPDGGR